MTALLGWVIIVAGLGSLALAALWPVHRFTRRAFPDRRAARWAYWSAAALLGTALWFAVPPLVHGLFGRTAP